MTVGNNSYVSLFKHHYSVPKEYVGRRMTILYDADTVEIYCGMNLVATHDPVSYTHLEHYVERVVQELPADFTRDGENYKLEVTKVYPEVKDGQFRTDFRL